ncbi:TPA: V-type ATP synthase subunit A [Candidatus Poribacteria bacterium]|nr:V-type ATP synthase subunit A [Candidatus Poribacteria bacterium]
MAEREGIVYRINGPVIEANQVTGIFMGDMVEVGEERLIGETIGLDGDTAIIQVYEDTSGLRPGIKVYGTGLPLAAELGPGLIANTYDGIQRPLRDIQDKVGNFITRGVRVPALDREKKWHFVPKVKVGDKVKANSVLGTVQETVLIEHRIIVPPDVEGEIVFIIGEGDYTVEEIIAKVKTATGERELQMFHRWPVRQKRSLLNRLNPSIPLVTGQRTLDFLFPIAKGGVAAIPGGFGTGKTVLQHSFAKWCDADIIVYIGCGERGNEMTQVLEEFPELVDPKSGRPLMERTVLIANTSNMPVTARESSIYTGITMGEYFRDMGYHVAIMADSTSRWAEALREISGRLEEMPAEEGFPAYLASRLAEFYERAGLFDAGDGKLTSVSIIGAVSPPGGDFSEPVTQHTRRFIRCFWGLDPELAGARHFPAINWIDSYSEYIEDLAPWWVENFGIQWTELRTRFTEILQIEQRLQQVVKLVGPDALPDSERLILEIARIIKIAFLQQNALSEDDAYCVTMKQIRMAQAILHFYDRAKAIIEKGAPIFTITGLSVVQDILRMKSRIPNDRIEEFDDLLATINEQMDELEERYK